MGESGRKSRREFFVCRYGGSDEVGEKNRGAKSDQGEDYQGHATKSADVAQGVVVILRSGFGRGVFVAVIDFADKRG